MDICIWDKCNNKCSMCTNPDDFSGEGYNYDLLIERIKKFKKIFNPKDAIILTGGETTIHPKFLDILRFVRKIFPKQEVRVLTNGRRFFYENFAKDVLKTKNLNLAVSLYGSNKKIHDSITRTKGSFTQTTKGIENILKLRDLKDHGVEIRTVISKLSCKDVEKTVELVVNKFSEIDRLILIFMEIEGQAEKNKKVAGITYKEVKNYIEKIYPYFNKLKEVRLYHFPLCTLDKKFWPYIWRTLPENEVSFVEICNGCNYKKYCLGIHNEYIKNIGTKEFKPIKEKVNIKETSDYYYPISSAK